MLKENYAERELTQRKMDKAELRKYRAFGYSRFGPFLYGFVRWLKSELVRKGYKKVFFFSRDGYMMKKAFDIINDTDIVSKYVFFSRKSLRTPLLHRCADFEDSLKYLSRERFISVGKLLEYYGFDEQQRQRLAKDGGFSLDIDIPYDKLKDSALAKRIYTQYTEQINDFSRTQDDLLGRYLEQIGMNGRFAIVDIGWMGNMQYYLELYLQSRAVPADIEGYYIGIERSAPVKSALNGYLYSPVDMSRKKQVICFFGGYEKLLQSLEGSVSGYRQGINGVEPVLCPYEYAGSDAAQIVSAVRQWQQGALCFVQKAFRDGLKDSDEKLTMPLIRFGMYPSIEDTRLFSFFYNTDGTKVYYTAQKPLYRYKPKEFIHALANSPWKTGFMKSAFKLPLPYHLVYKLLKK